MKKVTFLATSLALICSTFTAYATHAAETKPDCTAKIYRTGQADTATPTRYGLMLMGGGTDVDDAFRWLIQRSGGGDLVVLRSDGADGYNDYLYREIGGLNSVTTLVIQSREQALCPEVLQRLRQAESLFFAGGDQSEYYRFWKDTPMHTAIADLAKKQTPMGGTSAGLAILGEVIYSAEGESMQSMQVLNNPFHPELTLRNDFLKLPYMQAILTDSHFSERQRQGRLLAFLARARAETDFPSGLKGIGIDEQTALLVEKPTAGEYKDKIAGTVIGKGSVWFYCPGAENPEMMSPQKPLTWSHAGQAVDVFKMPKQPFVPSDPTANYLSLANMFDLGAWTPLQGNYQELFFSAEAGVFKQKLKTTP